MTTAIATLDTLAQDINAEHEAAIGSARTSIEHAIRCGELLNRAKEQCEHGEWATWLEKNCAVGEMQAWRYRELAKDPEYYRNKINSEVSFERLIDKKREADGTKRTRQTLPADPTLDPCTRETRELVDEETGEVLTAEVRPAVEGQPERLVIADPKPVQGGCEAKEMDAVDGVVGLLADAVYAMQKTDCRGWTAANKERVAEQVGAITRLLTE